MVTSWKALMLLAFLFFVSSCHGSSASSLSFPHGVLRARQNGADEKSFCVAYYPQFSSHLEDKKVYEPLIDLSSVWDGCNSSPPKTSAIMAKIVVVNYNQNCSIIEKVLTTERLGGIGLVLMATDKVMQHLPVLDIFPSSIPIVFIGNNSKDILQELGDNVKIFIHSATPDEYNHFDYSLLVVWSIAVVAVSAGSYWSGIIRHDLMLKKDRIAIQLADGEELSEESEAIMKEKLSISFNLTNVAVSVLINIVVLVLLYLYSIYSNTKPPQFTGKMSFSNMVYLFIALMGVPLMSACFYDCLNLIVPRIAISTKILYARKIVLFIASLSFVICWIVYRQEKFAWILQLILTFVLSVNLIKVLRLSSLKVCTYLSVLLFFYDIFFVFVTPFFTSNGRSVMEQVALEMTIQQLPIVFRVPYFGNDPLDVCWERYSLLGIGDVLIPGMLVGLCHGFDLARGNRTKVYYVATLIGYGLGLITAFMGLIVFNTPQPVLLYLVFFTFIPVVLIGLCRRELKLFWKGFEMPDLEKTEVTGCLPMDDEGIPMPGEDGNTHRISEPTVSQCVVIDDREHLMD